MLQNNSVMTGILSVVNKQYWTLQRDLGCPHSAPNYGPGRCFSGNCSWWLFHVSGLSAFVIYALLITVSSVNFLWWGFFFPAKYYDFRVLPVCSVFC